MAGVAPEEIRQRASHAASGGILNRGLREMETSRLAGLLRRPHLADMGILDTAVVEEA